jgi:hypothetical protein
MASQERATTGQMTSSTLASRRCSSGLIETIAP